MNVTLNLFKIFRHSLMLQDCLLDSVNTQYNFKRRKKLPKLKSIFLSPTLIL